MTGRAIGYCAGYPVPGFMNPGPWFGFGRGLSFGRGLGIRRGVGYMPQLSPDKEIRYLKQQAELLKQ